MAAIRIPIISQFNDKGLKEADTAISKFTAKASKGFAGLADFGKKLATGLGVAAVGVGAFATKAVGAASDIAEETAKAGELFGETTDRLEDFARAAAQRLGQSRAEALAGANTFAIFGKAAGLAGEDLYGFSTDFVELASDLASFNNTTPQQAIEAIGAALRGEAEPLRQYGILLDDATLKQKALELGIYDGNGALTQQQKIRAAEIAIYDQAATAQGDFARTSDGLANRQRILAAQFANVTASIGEKLLPIALRLAEFVQNDLLPIIGRMYQVALPLLTEWFTKARDAIVPVVQVMAEKLRPIVERITNWLKENTDVVKVFFAVLAGAAVIAMLAALAASIAALFNPLTLIIGGAAALAAGVYYLWTRFETFRDVVTGVFDVVKTVVKIAVDFVTGWFNALRDVVMGFVKILQGIFQGDLSKVMDGFKQLFRGGINTVIQFFIGMPRAIFSNIGGALINLGRDIVGAIVDGIKSAAGSIGSAILGAIPGGGAIKSAVGSVGKIATKVWPFAEGGIVTGPTLGLVGEAGPEAIIPLDRLRNMRGIGGGGDINITVTSADPNAVIEAIRSYNRQQGPAPIKVA